jgi:hypothetical protein
VDTGRLLVSRYGHGALIALKNVLTGARSRSRVLAAPAGKQILVGLLATLSNPGSCFSRTTAQKEVAAITDLFSQH